jgi:phage recombination protein Bet
MSPQYPLYKPVGAGIGAGAGPVTAIAPYESPPSLSRMQIDLLKRTVGANLTDLEFELFIERAKHTGLNPFPPNPQIYAIKRGDKMTIQAGIDGLRLEAQRTHEYAGNDDAIYAHEPGADARTDHPTTATVTVWRLVQGQRCPFTATTRYGEYAPQYKDKYTGKMELAEMWQKMPYTMLAKCAEAAALRKGFPAELSGLYIPEEMAQAGTTTVEADSAPPTPRRPAVQPLPRGPHPAEDMPVDAFFKACRDQYGLKPPQVLDKLGLTSVANVNRAEALTVLHHVLEKEQQQAAAIGVAMKRGEPILPEHDEPVFTEAAPEEAHAAEGEEPREESEPDPSLPHDLRTLKTGKRGN